MRILPCHGEPTRFFAESRTLECPLCKQLFPRKKWLSLKVGSPCPFCGPTVGALDVRFHLVDTAKFFPIGECACEAWQMAKKYGKTVRRMKPKDREALAWDEQEALRCDHIKAARSYSLNLSIKQHEDHRLAGAPGRNP